MLWMGIWVHPYTLAHDMVLVPFWGIFSKAGPEWCCGVMVEAAKRQWQMEKQRQKQRQRQWQWQRELKDGD
jgi:hypothetical protein